MKMVTRKVKVWFLGKQMVARTVASSPKTRCTDMVCLHGRMAESTKANGIKARCMAKVHFSTPTAESTEVNMRTIGKAVLGNTDGQMAVNTKANLLRVECMDQAFTLMQMARPYRVNGSKARVLKYVGSIPEGLVVGVVGCDCFITVDVIMS